MAEAAAAAAPEDGPRAWFVGQRVVDEEGNRATVRYIGPVASAKDPAATWIGACFIRVPLPFGHDPPPNIISVHTPPTAPTQPNGPAPPAGVEWDDPSRGKHDGSVLAAGGAVVRHFTCARPGPTSASFLKPAKLDRGVAFMEVLRRRYVAPDAPLEAPNRVFEGAYANTSKGGKKAIEFHGEEQIRARQQIGVLAKVSMRGARVAWAGAASALAEEAAHLVEVDVQGNLWADWEELGRLARQLPRLEVLHLNSNLMMPLPALAPASPLRAGAFPALRVLVLNNCGITAWPTVLNLERCLPCLEELGLAQNDLSHSDLGLALQERRQQQREAEAEAVAEGGPAGVGRHPVFYRLQSLDLSGTGLLRWGQVALLKGLPALCALSLNENELEAVGPDEEAGEEEGGEEGMMGFARLESLQLSCNRIERWRSIDALNALPCLRSLRFTSNPLVRGMGQSEARQLLIARVAGLTRLNGAEVSQRERADAEKSYLRRVGRELGRIAGEEKDMDREARLQGAKGAHPRWAELLRRHGDALGMGPDGALGGSAASAAGLGGGGAGAGLAREMLSVTLVSMAAASMTMAPVAKRLPGSLTVAQLKQLCHKLFGLEPALQVLYYRADADSAQGAPPTMLDADDETLAYFGLPAGGCRVFMNERDPQQEAREAAQRAAAEQARLEEQLRQVDMLDRLKRQQVGLDKLATVAAAQGPQAAQEAQAADDGEEQL